MRLNCRFCGKEHYKPAGFRKTKIGKKRVFKCMVCNRRFTPDNAYLRMKNEPSLISECISLNMSGMSFRLISQHLKREKGIDVSHMSIYRWVRKYSKLVTPYADSLAIDGTNTHLHADEMMVQMNGKMVWFWDIISRENRFLLASRFSQTRELDDAKALMKEARGKLDGLPMRITTDGLNSYPQAIKTAFATRSYPRVEHYIAPGLMARVHNKLIERHHNSIRSRIKVMRGFCDMESATDIMNLWHMYFNFCRPNHSLHGQTPSESAGLGRHSIKEMIEEAYEWKRNRHAGS